MLMSYLLECIIMLRRDIAFTKVINLQSSMSLQCRAHTCMDVFNPDNSKLACDVALPPCGDSASEVESEGNFDCSHNFRFSLLRSDSKPM